MNMENMVMANLDIKTLYINIAITKYLNISRNDLQRKASTTRTQNYKNMQTNNQPMLLLFSSAIVSTSKKYG